MPLVTFIYCFEETVRSVDHRHENTDVPVSTGTRQIHGQDRPVCQRRARGDLSGTPSSSSEPRADSPLLKRDGAEDGHGGRQAVCWWSNRLITHGTTDRRNVSKLKTHERNPTPGRPATPGTHRGSTQDKTRLMTSSPGVGGATWRWRFSGWRRGRFPPDCHSCEHYRTSRLEAVKSFLFLVKISNLGVEDHTDPKGQPRSEV